MSDYISKSTTMQRFQEEIKQSRRDCIHINTIKRLLDDIDTVDEKEIIRKAFERVVKQLSEQMPIKFNGFGKTLITVEDVIKILKEECGINE